MEYVNQAVELLGAGDVTTLAIWAGAGLLLGIILVGRRPLFFIGDVVLGVLGGIAGGWAFNRFGVDLGQYVTQIAPDVSETLAAQIGAGVEAAIGAIVLLILARIVIRRG
ncbi:MAG: hypothetical protein PVI23_10395 [Maricaulaceae bacterium]|jgi:hypothetical protein